MWPQQNKQEKLRGSQIRYKHDLGLGLRLAWVYGKSFEQNFPLEISS